MLGVVVLFVAVTGCGDRTPTADVQSPVASATSAATPTPCGDATPGVAFPREDGTRLVGYVVGAGQTGVVLANQVGMSACAWMSYAKALAARGYRVLAFDFAGEGLSARGGTKLSADVAAAAGYLRQQGVTRLVLIGASRGGTAVVVAGAAVTPPVTAVISLSAPASYGGEDAAAAAPKLSGPAVLYVAAEHDGSFAANAQALYAATPGIRRKLVIVPGDEHGAGFMLIAGEGSTEALAAVEAFLAANAPA